MAAKQHRLLFLADAFLDKTKRKHVGNTDNHFLVHYDDVIMGTIASQITSLTSVYSTVYSGADQSKHQSSASLAFVWGIHRGPVNSPHKWPVTRKMFPFDDVIMESYIPKCYNYLCYSKQIETPSTSKGFLFPRTYWIWNICIIYPSQLSQFNREVRGSNPVQHNTVLKTAQHGQNTSDSLHEMLW